MNTVPRYLQGILKIKHRHILATIGIFLAVGWGLFVVVDVLNVAGSRDILVATGLERPMFWAHLFRECGPAEWLQWTCLGLSAVLMGVAGGRVYSKQPVAAWFWLILAVGMALLLVEDAGNPRHRVRIYVTLLSDSYTLGHAAEFACFSLLALTPLYALLRFGSGIWHLRTTRFFITMSFVIYAVIGLSNATRHWGEWHAYVGTLLYDILDLELAVYMPQRPDLPPGFWLMDKLVEESFELVGAACFLTAVVAFLHESPEWDAAINVAKKELSPRPSPANPGG